MLTQFRVHYPQGSILSELLTIDRGMYIVRCSVQVEGTTLASGMAADQTVESAEDRARDRAIAALSLSESRAKPQETSIPAHPTPVPATSTTPTVFKTQSLDSIPPTQFPPTSQKTSGNGISLSESDHQTRNDDGGIHRITVEEKPIAVKFSPIKPQPSFEVFEEPHPPQLDSQPVEIPATYHTPNEEVSLPLHSPQKFDSSPIDEFTPDIPTDMSEVMTRTTVAMKRLGWTTQQGIDYLKATYGKRSRQMLKDDELIAFLRYLESQPSPD